MIYLKANGTTYVLDGHADITTQQAGSIYQYPMSILNGVIKTGFGAKEITLQIPSDSGISPFEIDEISFDNTTWSKVLFVEELSDRTRPDGWTGLITLKIYAEPYRTGTAHTSSEVWGKTSVSLTTNGNYKPAPVKLTYKGAQYYFPLDTDLKAHTGDALSYTRSGSLSYNGVSYDANNPIFDEGLYFNGDESVNLTENDTISDYTMLLLLRWKNDTGYAGTILKTNKFSIDWTSATSITIHGTADHSITFPQSSYEAGDPVALIITHKSDGTTNFICGVYGTTTETLTTPASVNFTDTALNDLTGTVYVGYDGSTGHISEHSISDLTIYEYEVPNASTAEWHLTIEPLQWNDFYIANVTSGTITYQDGKLTDEDGNDITGLVSGTPLTEGTIEMKAGLSGLWSVEADDTYLP